LKGRRSLETVLVELKAKQNRSQNPSLARMIEGIEAEIVQRRRIASRADELRQVTGNSGVAVAGSALPA
jgi:hypothetical protein